MLNDCNEYITVVIFSDCQDTFGIMMVVILSGKKDDERDEDTKQEDSDDKQKNPRPRALHKTCSIFLRNLAPSITKQEVEAVCTE